MTADKIPGILLCIILAIFSWLLGQEYPLVGGPVFGILIGICLASFFSDQLKKIRPGAGFAAKRLLQLSIILLGFEMNLYQVVEVGSNSLIVMCFTLTAAFLTAWAFSRLLKIDGTTAALIGVGTSICGGSAIAASAPVLRANDEQIIHSISTIFLFNIAAVFIFPFLGHLLNMSDTGFGVWAGTAVNDTSSVLAAGYAFSDEAGKLATIVKLTRTLMIIPITFVLSLYIARKDKGESGFSLSNAIPWFIGGFILTTLVNTSGFLPTELSKQLGTCGKFFIVVAMVGIGLNTNLRQLIRNGTRPILLGLICWFVLSVVSLIVQYELNIM